MNEPKSLLTELGEALDRYHAGRRAAQSARGVSASRPGRLRSVLRWFLPNGGTLLLIAVLLLSQNAWARPAASPAAAPGPSATTVNYQGRLANPDGSPVADGNYGMDFALYATETGGSPLWTESHSAVPVSGGLFSVGLGSRTAGGIPTSTWDGDRYLEITVGGETLSPRELIRSVPVAGMALTVPDGAINSTQIADGAIGSRQMAPSWYEGNSGSIIQATSDEPVSTNTSVTFSCETDCTALILHRGTVAHSVQDGRVNVSVWVDGVREFYELGVSNVAYGTSTQKAYHQVSGFDFVNLAAGSHTVEVKLRCSTSGTCYYYGYNDWEHLNVLVFSQP